MFNKKNILIAYLNWSYLKDNVANKPNYNFNIDNTSVCFKQIKPTVSENIFETEVPMFATNSYFEGQFRCVDVDRNIKIDIDKLTNNRNREIIVTKLFIKEKEYQDASSKLDVQYRNFMNRYNDNRLSGTCTINYKENKDKTMLLQPDAIDSCIIRHYLIDKTVNINLQYKVNAFGINGVFNDKEYDGDGNVIESPSESYISCLAETENKIQEVKSELDITLNLDQNILSALSIGNKLIVYDPYSSAGNTEWKITDLDATFEIIDGEEVNKVTIKAEPYTKNTWYNILPAAYGYDIIFNTLNCKKLTKRLTANYKEKETTKAYGLEISNLVHPNVQNIIWPGQQVELCSLKIKNSISDTFQTVTEISYNPFNILEEFKVVLDTNIFNLAMTTKVKNETTTAKIVESAESRIRKDMTSQQELLKKKLDLEREKLRQETDKWIKEKQRNITEVNKSCVAMYNSMYLFERDNKLFMNGIVSHINSVHKLLGYTGPSFVASNYNPSFKPPSATIDVNNYNDVYWANLINMIQKGTYIYSPPSN